MALNFFTFEISPVGNDCAFDIYNKLMGFDFSPDFFELQMVDSNELIGEYTIVSNVEEDFYDITTRSIITKQAQKAYVVRFRVVGNRLEVRANKSGANRLVFSISRALANRISFNLIDISIQKIVSKLKSTKAKISRVSFQDFVFANDIIGCFTTDLSTHSDGYSIVEQHQEKIIKMTIILPLKDSSVKLNISSTGSILAYRNSSDFDEEIRDFINTILF